MLAPVGEEELNTLLMMDTNYIITLSFNIPTPITAPRTHDNVGTQYILPSCIVPRYIYIYIYSFNSSTCLGPPTACCQVQYVWRPGIIPCISTFLYIIPVLLVY